MHFIPLLADTYRLLRTWLFESFRAIMYDASATFHVLKYLMISIDAQNCSIRLRRFDDWGISILYIIGYFRRFCLGIEHYEHFAISPLRRYHYLLPQVIESIMIRRHFTSQLLSHNDDIYSVSAIRHYAYIYRYYWFQQFHAALMYEILMPQFEFLTNVTPYSTKIIFHYASKICIDNYFAKPSRFNNISYLHW